MSGDVARVGLVGHDERADRIFDDLVDAGFDVETGEGAWATSSTRDIVVAVGERSVATVVANEPACPIVPVGTGPGIRSVPAEALAGLTGAIETEGWELERHVPLTVAVDDESIALAVFDVTLVTAEPARISEYELVADGERLGRSRADGVVLATAAGSTDYARRVDVPILDPASGTAVAWIAPFRTDPDHWVTGSQRIEVHVERDEATVDLLVDERVVRAVDVDQVVRVSPGPPFEVAVLPGSLPRYA